MIILKGFWMWEIFKVFIEFAVILFLFYVLFFWAQACELLTPWPGVSPAPPALENKVLTPGMPGRSHEGHFGFLFNFLFILGYSRLASSVEIFSSEQGRDSAIHRHAPILPPTPSHPSSQCYSSEYHHSEQSSTCPMVGPCWLSILNTLLAVCTSLSHTA